MPEPLTPEQEAAARKIRPSFEGHSDDCALCLLAAALATIDALRADAHSLSHIGAEDAAELDRLRPSEQVCRNHRDGGGQFTTEQALSKGCVT
jgi:hypothetical protein